jgi:hypothetical protein
LVPCVISRTELNRYANKESSTTSPKLEEETVNEILQFDSNYFYDEVIIKLLLRVYDSENYDEINLE